MSNQLQAPAALPSGDTVLGTFSVSRIYQEGLRKCTLSVADCKLEPPVFRLERVTAVLIFWMMSLNEDYGVTP